MENPKFEISHINYSGFNKLDKSEIKEIENIVSNNIKQIKRYTNIIALRLHLKILHEKKDAKQMPTHKIDVTLETDKGNFFSTTENRNLYTALNDVLENLLKQLKHKHPRKEEWKESYKSPKNKT